MAAIAVVVTIGIGSHKGDIAILFILVYANISLGVSNNILFNGVVTIDTCLIAINRHAAWS